MRPLPNGGLLFHNQVADECPPNWTLYGQSISKWDFIEVSLITGDYMSQGTCCSHFLADRK